MFVRCVGLNFFGVFSIERNISKRFFNA